METYAGQATQRKTFYDRTLLSRLTPKLIFFEYGQKKPMPKKEGDTVDFRRFSRLNPATAALVEGVTPAADNITITNVTATVAQYGSYITFSDKIDEVGIDPFVTETLEVQGEQAGETLDTIVRDIIAGGTNFFYVGGGVQRADVAAAHTVDGATMRRVRQIMARNNVRPLAGNDYVAFIHPDIAYDIMGDAAWVNANQYAGSTKLFNGEIGKLYGVRYIETTMAPIYENEGAGAAVDVYATLVIGKDAYGIPDIAGSAKPETIVKQVGSSGVGDPLNQRGSCGWKCMLTAVRLQELAILRVESACSVA